MRGGGCKREGKADSLKLEGEGEGRCAPIGQSEVQRVGLDIFHNGNSSFHFQTCNFESKTRLDAKAFPEIYKSFQVNSVCTFTYEGCLLYVQSWKLVNMYLFFRVLRIIKHCSLPNSFLGS